MEFRFSKRIGNATSAHETGMFLYMTVDADGKETRHYIHMEGLLTKTKKPLGHADGIPKIKWNEGRMGCAQQADKDAS